MTAMTDEELAELERAVKSLRINSEDSTTEGFIASDNLDDDAQGEDVDDVARLLSAAPRLLAAARERNALAAEVERARLQEEWLRGEIERLTKERDAAESVEPPVTLSVCDAAHVTPRPGRLYRFIAVEGCPDCALIVEPYQDAEGWIWPAHPTEEVAHAGRFVATRHHGDIGICDDHGDLRGFRVCLARTKSTNQARRIVEALAAAEERAVEAERDAALADASNLRSLLAKCEAHMEKWSPEVEQSLVYKRERDAARLALRMAEEHVTMLVGERDAARAELVELARHATIHTKHRAPDCTPSSCTKCLAERVLAALAAGAKEETT